MATDPRPAPVADAALGPPAGERPPFAAVFTVALGSVTRYDAKLGWGEISLDRGGRVGFHCTAIADGSRRIDPGTRVALQLRPVGPGRVEATGIRSVASEPKS